MTTITLDELKGKVGGELGVSKWFDIDQPRINQFADITEDWQYIHIDAERAKETPFGTTIAHGFLTLSMLSAMAIDGVPSIEGSKMAVNYGFEKIRFLSPVPSGARVRGVFKLADLKENKPGEMTLYYDVSVEIEGSDRPALAAVWIGRQYF
jgi:acyl dehydratase